MNRWIAVGLFSAGVMVGVKVVELSPEFAVSAQGGWQCRSWTLETQGSPDAIGPWLGTAARVEISTADVLAGRYVLVACKQ